MDLESSSSSARDKTESYPEQSSPNGKSSHPTSKLVSLLRWINDYWVLEIASCIGGIAVLFCIIGVLFKYDGTAIPDWPYGITINSVLSWIVMVFNTLMLGTIASCFGQMAWVNFSTPTDKPLSDVSSYHWASRGAIGCVAFIWGSKMRNLASLGALATILAVGVNPFVQQMATVQNNRVPVDLPAFVGRAQTYLESGTLTAGDIPTDGMLAAIYSFLLTGHGSSDSGNSSTASHPSIPMTCDSGDCDFSPFRSLAVCSDCSDISNELTSQCEDGSCTPEKTMCHHSLSNEMQFNISDYMVDSEPSFQTKTPHMLKKVHYGEQPNDRSIILNLTEIRIPSLSNKTELKNPIATKCSLYWCVNTYSARVRNHKLFENLMESWYDPNAQANWSRLDLQPPTKDNLTQSNFTIQSWATQNIQSWLSDKMELSNIPRGKCSDHGPSITPSNPTTEFFRPMLRSSLNDTFQTLATAMTTRVRQLGSAAQNTTPYDIFGPIPLESIGPAKGRSFKVETQIKVQWPWVIVPSLLVILTSIFLGITIFKTRQHGLKAWKYSPMALVCSGLDENTQQQVRLAGDPTKMEAVAADIQVHLLKSEAGATVGGWRLEATPSSVQP